MRFIIFIALLSLTTSLFSQNRKTILSEVSSYKNQIIREASYPATKDSLRSVLSYYLNQEDYVIDTVNADTLVYYKRLGCYGEQQFLDGNNKKQNIIYRNFYISVQFFSQNNKRLNLKFSTSFPDSYTSNYAYNQDVLSSGTSSVPVNGKGISCFSKGEMFYYSEMEIRRFLYHHFNRQTIVLPKELTLKIEEFNKEEKKDKKKITKGRDY